MTEPHNTINLSLTGENSHQVCIPKGQGSLSIGTKGLSEGKYDIWVEDNCPIYWDAFNEFYIPASRGNPQRPPYGDWPRWFYYSGNDMGFIPWSSKRHIEDFSWMPQKGVCVDLAEANIHRFFLHIPKEPTKLRLGGTIRQLFLSGHLENLDIQAVVSLPSLQFGPFASQEKQQPYQLPVFDALKHVHGVSIHNEPMGQAFDCGSLLQFSEITWLSLWGNFTNLEALAEFKNLESLELRYVPDLTGMPGLAYWKNLRGFIGWNIEETAGKALRAELRQLSKEREFSYSSVSQLRKAVWFATEYGIPFSGWESKKAKAATRAYKACLKEVRKAENEDGVREAIVRFVAALNQLPDLETIEREDAGTAVSQLVEAAELGISQETGQAWFDEARDF